MSSLSAHPLRRHRDLGPATLLIRPDCMLFVFFIISVVVLLAWAYRYLQQILTRTKPNRCHHSIYILFKTNKLPHESEGWPDVELVF